MNQASSYSQAFSRAYILEKNYVAVVAFLAAGVLKGVGRLKIAKQIGVLSQQCTGFGEVSTGTTRQRSTK